MVTLVLFQSHASNYVANDSNGLSDVYVFDASTGLVELISINPLGETGDGSSQYTRISRWRSLCRIRFLTPTTWSVRIPTCYGDVFVSPRAPGGYM